MNMILRKTSMLLAFILLAATVSAVIIEPDKLVFENVLNYGYAEKIITIKSPGSVSLSATEPINKWLSFEPVGESDFKVIVKPLDAPLGTYQGYIIVNTISPGNDLTTAVSTADHLKTTIIITDEQITQANVKDVVIKDIELNNPIKILVTIENQGNSYLLPYFEASILDTNKNLLYFIASQEKTLNPSSTDIHEALIPNNLAIGKYYADVKVYADDMLLRKHLLSFDVVKPGSLPAEKEEISIKIHPAPVPLSVNWAVIVVWILILAFVIWKIARNRPKKK
jgi:hypothetical protein